MSLLGLKERFYDCLHCSKRHGAVERATFKLGSVVLSSCWAGQQDVCRSAQPLKFSGFYPLLVLRDKEDQAGSKAGWECASHCQRRVERLVVGF